MVIRRCGLKCGDRSTGVAPSGHWARRGLAQPRRWGLPWVRWCRIDRCLALSTEVAPDVVDFEERDRRLRLPVKVEDLPLPWVLPRAVGVAAAEGAVVGHDHHLEHVVVKRLRHRVERDHVPVQRWNCEHVGTIPQVSGQSEIRRVVADRCSQPERLVSRCWRPVVTDSCSVPLGARRNWRARPARSGAHGWEEGP